MCQDSSQSLGPYKVQAVADLFQTTILDHVHQLANIVDKTYSTATHKSQSMLSEYQRQQALLQDLVVT